MRDIWVKHTNDTTDI